ncbi:MAG: hypothetical protein ACLQNG_01075 [Acidimicrobiales bacterium]
MPATGNVPTAGWTRADWKASALLAGLPALLLAAAAGAGYPLITGDDLTQNYPLEELSGQILRHGHLPLWDGFLWSGTPLLGGTNAHALLPITLLFALLPPVAAWVVGEVVVLAAAAIGCQLFLRRTGCGTPAAALAGCSFGLGGFVSSQVVHIDFVAAAAALPWALVALHGLATRPPPSRPRHALLLGLAAAWMCLCGSPDIVIDAIVVCGAYLAHLVLQPLEAERRAIDRLRLCSWTLAGGVAGVALGALQWLPSASFVSASQRAHPSFSFISGGSLDGANFLELLVPHVLGGGLLGSRAFGGTFPLAEVDAYPGVVALVAVFVMLASWRQASAWRWRVWLLVCAAALLVVSGDHTPLEHVIAALPVVGDQRLPSRGLIGFALATSLLSGYFIDALLLVHPTRRQIAAGLVPLVAIGGVVVATVVTGKPAGGALTAHAGTGWTLSGVVPDLLLSTLLAAAGASLLLFGRRLEGRRRLLIVAALVVVDLVGFDINQSSFAPEYASALSPADGAAVAALAAPGRYLVIDPHLLDSRALDGIGAPDLGVVDALADAGGYGSLLWGPYSAATGTHTQDGASLAAVADGTFAALGVRALLVLPSELVTAGAPPPAGPVIRAGAAALRWFGTTVAVASVTLRATAGASPAALRALGGAFTLLANGGRPIATAGSELASEGELTVAYPAPVLAAGLEIRASPAASGLELSEPLVRPAHGPAFSTGTPLSLAVAAGGWVQTGELAGFDVLTKVAAPPFEVTAAGASVTLVAGDVWTGSASVTVRTPRTAELVRSVAALPGWRATLEHAGRLSEVPVRRHGLVQSIDVPAGDSTVTFFYVAPGWALAQVVALLGALGCAALVLAPAVARRRRRLSGGGARSPAPG